MIKIRTNARWDKTLGLLFNKDIFRRYDWFLWEFGRRMTGLVNAELMGHIDQIKGSRDYKKRLVVAEIRDTTRRAWWAIVARSKTLQEGEYDAKTSILIVSSRYKSDKENPVTEVLEQYGPWTVDTIPFVPSQRQAAIVLKKVSASKVNEVRRRNENEQSVILPLMKHFEMDFDPRFVVQQKLRIVPDLEVEAVKLEFGTIHGGKAHWRPSIRWAKRQGVAQMQKDKELIRAMTDPKFKGFRKLKHLEERLTSTEVKALEDFQKKIRRASN